MNLRPVHVLPAKHHPSQIRPFEVVGRDPLQQSRLIILKIDSTFNNEYKSATAKLICNWCGQYESIRSQWSRPHPWSWGEQLSYLYGLGYNNLFNFGILKFQRMQHIYIYINWRTKWSEPSCHHPYLHLLQVYLQNPPNLQRIDISLGRNSTKITKSAIAVPSYVGSVSRVGIAKKKKPHVKKINSKILHRTP